MESIPNIESSTSFESQESSNLPQLVQSPTHTNKSTSSELQSEEVSSSSSKEPSNRSKTEPIEALSVGLLAEFSSLKELEIQLEQIVNNQRDLLGNVLALNNFYTNNEDMMEVQLMMKKMNLYRMKLKKIRSDMLYIRSTSQSLLQKAIDLQNIKVNQKAERVRRYDYEIGLIAKAKQ